MLFYQPKDASKPEPSKEKHKHNEFEEVSKNDEPNKASENDVC